MIIGSFCNQGAFGKDKFETFRDKLEDLCLFYTKAAHEATRFFKFHITRLLEAELPIPPIDQTLWGRCIRRTTRRGDERVAEVQVVDDEKLQDGQVWQISDVARHVSRAVARWKPDMILTFDADGVSGHSNHGACFGGVLESRKEMRDCPSFMVLKTVPLWRKYFRWLDSLFPLRLTPEQRLCRSQSPGRSMRAMRTHRSQMAWFRWIWLLLSSYMHRNVLERLA
ncbi:hypothetical protein H632_c2336p0 [Helicosporidium sp. ATCC 50920]|nr:hypothetical protein H632_c2336p0 [Helicosporidium sp. ATCC 50920]|eukprot:KDD73292.1 hypothetical protein H632_c2336p0 [Helicosporidium sp. ATCC 50920]